MIVYGFPGQGSQHVGMGVDFACYQPLYGELTSMADRELGFSMEALVEDASQLSQTTYTQPALLWASTLAYRIFREQGGPQPDYLCGHSLGEYSALCAAEVLDFSDALLLVQKRGELMQQQLAPEQSLMAVVLGLTDQQVESMCKTISDQLGDSHALFAANYNAKGQVVVAGKASALTRLRTLASELGTKRVLPLSMSVPSHCPLMQNAATELAKYMHDRKIIFRDARIPVVQNVNAKEYTSGQRIQQNLIEQLTQPVQWHQTMQYLINAQVFIESGPGIVLQGLAKRVLTKATIHGIGNPENIEKAIEQCG